MNADVEGFVKLFIVAIIVVSLLPSFLSFGLPNGSAELTASAGETVTLDSTVQDIPASVSVQATKENALKFDGESYVASSGPSDLDNGSWSVCVSTHLPQEANANATYTAYAYNNSSILIQYDAGEWMAYHDNGTVDGKATVASSGPNQDDSGLFFGWFSDDSKDFVPVCGVYNATSNEISVTAEGQTSTSSLSSSTTSRNVSEDWVGTLDEVRTFDGALSSNQVDQYMSDPIKPMDGANRTSRLMFDEGSGSTTTVYFAGTSATINGAAWTNGVQGPNLEKGTDYELHEEPFAITILSGGYLEGSPVQFVSWGSLVPFNVISLMGVLFSLFLMVMFANRIQEFL